MGRVSLNPIVHIDPFGTILVPLLLIVWVIRGTFGWAKPTPVITPQLQKPLCATTFFTPSPGRSAIF